MILVPALRLIFHVPMQYAISTSIVSVIATSIPAVATNIMKGLTNVRLGMVLEVAAVLGGMFGALLATMVPSVVLTWMFAAVALIAAAMMALRATAGRSSDSEATARTSSEDGNPAADGSTIPEASALGNTYFDLAEGRSVTYDVRKPGLGFLFSSIAGVLSGMLGVGGGFVMVPLVHLICRVPVKAATATSSFMVGITPAASVFIYYFRGAVDPTLAASVVLGVLAGSFLGATISQRLPGRVVQASFVIFLVFVAVQMLSQASSQP